MMITDRLPIKPLHWSKQDDETYVAETWLGEIKVADFGDMGWIATIPSYGGGWSEGEDNAFETAEDAMVSAEQDLRAHLAPFLTTTS